mgnify:CR=1 FL=1
MKMVQRFKMLSALLLVFVLVLAGCGTSGGGNGGSSETNAGDQAANQSAANKSDNTKKFEGVTLTLATVNNPDMKIMQKLTPVFEEQTGIKVNYVVLPENDLRKQVTMDVSSGAGKFDIVTIGTYDTPIWAKNGWIENMDPYLSNMSDEEKQAYDLEDIFPSIRDALSYDNHLYAIPFNAESSILYYNKEKLAKAGVEIPKNPTWEQVAEAARQVKAANNEPGIIIRGLPGWGEMLAPVNTIINAFGGRWYDENWNAQLDSPETVAAIQFYVDLLAAAGQPGATTTGFTEALTLMQQGKAAMWYDATTAAGFLEDPKVSTIAGKVGYALAPSQAKDNNGWLWSWALGIEASSKNKEAAFKFVTWATSKEYIQLVGESEGWVVVPGGTRKSTYENENYKKAAPFADITLEAMNSTNYKEPSLKPVPYVGIQYVAIPEFQQLGTEVSQDIAAAIAGSKTVEQAMKDAQARAERVAVDGGYKK